MCKTVRLIVLSLCGLLILLFFSPSKVQAFDGDRKGFLLGFGLGATPVANWTRSFGDFDETEQGFVIDISIGHGFGSQDVVVWNLFGSTTKWDTFSDKEASVGINGVQWYHYLSNRDRSLYTSVGGGVLAFVRPNSFGGGRGPAFKGEIGYEFHRHFQIGAYGIVGWTGSGNSDTSHKQFGFLLRLIAY